MQYTIYMTLYIHTYLHFSSTQCCYILFLIKNSNICDLNQPKLPLATRSIGNTYLLTFDLQQYIVLLLFLIKRSNICDLKHPKLPLVKWLQKALVTTTRRYFLETFSIIFYHRATSLALATHSGLFRKILVQKSFCQR